MDMYLDAVWAGNIWYDVVKFTRNKVIRRVHVSKDASTHK